MADKNVIAEKIPPILLRALASTYELYYASQTAHWNVEGPDFISLHDLFKDMYENAANTIDEVAERIRQLDEMIPNTLPELLKQSAVTADQEKTLTDKLFELHEKLEDQWNSIAVVAEAAEDSATVDVAGRKAGEHGKFCWILRSLSRKHN